MCAFEQAAQHILRAVRPVQPVRRRMAEARFDLQLALLDPGPQLVVDDPEFGRFADDPFAPVIQAGLAALRLRVLVEAAAVIDDPANIGLVVQDAGAAVAMAAELNSVRSSLPVAAWEAPSSRTSSKVQKLSLKLWKINHIEVQFCEALAKLHGCA
nr:hypothetical protein [Shinella pollutisoli]